MLHVRQRVAADRRRTNCDEGELTQVEKYFDRIRFNKVQHPSGKWHEWVSEEVSVPFLDNKSFRINLDFGDKALDLFEEEISLRLRNILQLSKNWWQELKPHLFAYYQDVLHTIGEEQMREDMPILATDATIFEYVNLKQMSIGRGFRNGKFYANFCGGCGWDAEHGVSISFESGEELAMVSSIGHICNSDSGGEDKDRYIYAGSFIQTTRSDL